MTDTFRLGDDGAAVFPVTDTAEPPEPVDWADPQVTAGGQTIDAEWLGVPATTRDLSVPIGTLSVGTYDLWLNIPGQTDILLGQVEIVDPTVVSDPASTACLWPLDQSCLGDEWETYTAAVQLRAHRLASASLARLTAGRVGVCPVTVRPQPRRNTCWFAEPYMLGVAYPHPYVNGSGQWVNCLPCSGDDLPCSVALPAPVGRVDEVKVNGAVLDPVTYTTYGNRLVWMGEGDCPFPDRQDVTAPDTEPGTFSVTYLNAYPVDSLGAQAAGTLAVEFARACANGKAKCSLPSGVRAIARQGVTMDIPNGAFPDGKTGIREVDQYVAIWNPHNRTHAPVVYSPDMPKVY